MILKLIKYLNFFKIEGFSAEPEANSGDEQPASKKVKTEQE